MENINFNINYSEAFVSADERAAMQTEVQAAKATLLSREGKGNDFLGG